MRGFQKFMAFQTADGAVVLIGPNNPFAERRLVQALSKQAGRIPPTDRRLFFVVSCSQACEHALVNADGEGEPICVVSDDINWPLCGVQARYDSVKVNKRNSLLHGRPKTDVVSVVWVGSPIAVAKQAVSAEGVVIGTCLALDDGLGHDA